MLWAAGGDAGGSRAGAPLCPPAAVQENLRLASFAHAPGLVTGLQNEPRIAVIIFYSDSSAAELSSEGSAWQGSELLQRWNHELQSKDTLRHEKNHQQYVRTARPSQTECLHYSQEKEEAQQDKLAGGHSAQATAHSYTFRNAQGCKGCEQP